jgi:hypothetical protein
MSKLFTIGDLVRVKMTLQGGRTIHPGEIATVAMVQLKKGEALYDLQFGDGTMARRISPIAVEARA